MCHNVTVISHLISSMYVYNVYYNLYWALHVKASVLTERLNTALCALHTLSRKHQQEQVKSNMGMIKTHRRLGSSWTEVRLHLYCVRHVLTKRQDCWT